MFVGIVQNIDTGIVKPVCLTNISINRAIQLAKQWITDNDEDNVYYCQGAYEIDLRYCRMSDETPRN